MGFRTNKLTGDGAGRAAVGVEDGTLPLDLKEAAFVRNEVLERTGATYTRDMLRIGADEKLRAENLMVDGNEGRMLWEKKL